ncbi:MAG: class I SAM-dependent DNA methyltransferase [Spirochaetaceae bacterium]
MTEDYPPNLYTNTAAWYDMDTSQYSAVDLEFYREAASRTGGPVLELACGTGRISIPLAADGHEVWALDLSAPMLAELARKAAALSPEVRNRLNVVQGSMCDFTIARQFELIIIPFRAFQALTSERDAAACLQAVRKHLSSDGVFIIDIFKVDDGETVTCSTTEQIDWERVDPRTGQTVRRARRTPVVDTSNQIVYPEVIVYTKNQDGSVARHVDRLALRYYYEYQMQVLLLTNGFRIEAVYGSYDKRPVASGSELLYICRHSVGVPALG